MGRVPARRAALTGPVLAIVPLALAPTLAFGAWGRLHTPSTRRRGTRSTP
jgi:hypothetical protein